MTMTKDHGFLPEDLGAAIADTWPNMMTPYPVVVAMVFEEADRRGVQMTRFYVPDSRSYVGVKHLHPSHTSHEMTETGLCNIRATCVDWRWPHSHRHLSPEPVENMTKDFWTTTRFLDWKDKSHNKLQEAPRDLCPEHFLHIPLGTQCPLCDDE